MPTNQLRRRAGIKAFALFAVLALLAGGIVYYRTHAPAREAGFGFGKRGGKRPPQPVSVALVKQQDMPIWLTAIGSCVPRNQVTVRSRVDGELLRLGFVEGQMVRQGQLLAEIDPRPFQAQLAQASGQLAKDSATLRNAELDLERYRDLWRKDAIAKQQLDTQEALVRQYQGSVEADRAQVESAKLQLTFSRIVAPVAGRIGLRQVDPGNQVHAADANGLAVITQIQPTTVVFAVPETYLPEIAQSLRKSEPVVVEAWDREQKQRLATGRLLTMDNLVDSATGTIKLKAEFANRDGVLFPNQFVVARLLLGVRGDAIVVPSAALLRGARGVFVYTVDAGGTVAAVPVKPGPANGELVAVEGDLRPGSRIVADGADKLRDGAKVEVIVPGAANGGPRDHGGPRPGGDGAKRRHRPEGDAAPGH